ncbi:uncharacterized protein LOC143890136 [Tasmannia lanceolata]|uniref:uncharacterized protein LOC143890136 n=1 Tax=Tasmannia lanceolata TaxID=3420 RepID=UPI004062A7F5
MRNPISCCIFNTKPLAKFIDPNGNLRLIGIPAQAAELMLESPGYLVAPVEELSRTRRISAMRADEELEIGKLYLMFPVSRVNCWVSEREIVAIDSATCRNKKGKTDGSRVFPERERVMVLEVDDDDDEGERDTGFAGHRLNSYRQWKPVLEPVNEES